eukprot:CAMPEP_0185729012 /NCGR_PEP_ID=MMETSP1171-20130828/4418_1 /TAXON_ID=374046 /ORGANISM="Helicotheca tamensis, Strain CCMP826" /LENGTH=106 /DNA_ID=CAMNT_0028397775 /DNA_START=87 /DNA_END=407 /DNA_ORIENTATION=+
MSTNPITNWIKSTMEKVDDIELRMKDRVAEASINAQKLSDERHGPHKSHLFFRNERRDKGFNNFYQANSAFKGKEAGCVNSFKSARYYMGEAAKERDAILERIAQE